mmetsp:Transcript_39145/g.122448  ORF Transcript_39145/g.122448 Transcript_39145/m.122448 type:complete len:379 (-) Transcript_39145:37-1173(-)|eukprot:CAMPEP_0118852160 /NCGR_PEP_ID=MMETSP1163-20130328/1295_1 /TAXON_ID=124430 /ORGANISM="Phaeomonas parva, Strain CCMP2877" /LENGTH=378 /DNA_ID=CAMNT_0006784567 /DNA_START=52 /DNA_END=1188 /DNA_ORIENTATION=+
MALRTAAVLLAACVGVARPMAIAKGGRTPAPRVVLPPEEAAWRGATPKQSSLPLKEDGKPDYTSIDKSPISLVLISTIRKLLVNEVGGVDRDPRPWTNFDAILTPVREVNDMDGAAEDVQVRARRVFEGILPSLGIGWVPPLWREYIKPNTPEVAQNFAFFLVFYTLFPWLMGPMEGAEEVDVPLPEAWRKLLPFLPETVKLPQAVKAERCRFLESSSCASVCVNSCKVPSQEWLREDFGMPIHIQPNYDDFSCVWKFGVEPPPLYEDEAIMVPCFANCDSNYKGQANFRERAMKMGFVDGLLETAELASVRARGGDFSATGVTEQGTALNEVNLVARKNEVSRKGKCWSVAKNRKEARGDAVEASGDKINVEWDVEG